MSRTVDITQLLDRYRLEGDTGALDNLLAGLYDEMKRLARRQLGRGRASETLDTTALVHETYLKLAQGSRLDLQDRHHLMRTLARAMRQLIVDQVRSRRAAKRGGEQLPETLHEQRVASSGEAWQPENALAVDRALREMGDPRLVEIVECRFFAGLTEEETADALGLSRRTVQRDWLKAKHRLRRAFQSTDGADS